MNANTSTEPSGSWDSIHVFEVAERGRQAHYKITSTVMLHLTTRKSSSGDVSEKEAINGIEGWKRGSETNLSGSMTRQVSSQFFEAQTLGLDDEILFIDRTRLAHP